MGVDVHVGHNILRREKTVEDSKYVSLEIMRNAG